MILVTEIKTNSNLIRTVDSKQRMVSYLF